MIAQIFGAVTASFFLKASLPADTLNHPFVTLGSLSDQHWIQVLILESVSTMIVVLIIFATVMPCQIPKQLRDTTPRRPWSRYDTKDLLSGHVHNVILLQSLVKWHPGWNGLRTARLYPEKY